MTVYLMTHFVLRLINYKSCFILLELTIKWPERYPYPLLNARDVDY